MQGLFQARHFSDYVDQVLGFLAAIAEARLAFRHRAQDHDLHQRNGGSTDKGRYEKARRVRKGQNRVFGA